MFIKSITIEGIDGDIEMAHVNATPDRAAGVLVMELTESTDREMRQRRGNRTICRMECSQSREEQFAAAIEATKAICGTTKRGEVNATNSMIHEVWQQMQRVAGC